MPRKLRVCFIQPAGGSVHAADDAASEEMAIRERVDNIRVTPISGARTSRPRAAVERFKLWQNGRRLRVQFLDGVSEVQEKVAAIATEWEEVANIHFDFVTGANAELRISFAEAGFSWSTVGTDALTVSRTRPTMNYGWLEPDTPIREYQRVVRHEFGHALGMIHEHQNPAAAGQIPWDKPKVYEYYAQQGWTEEDVDQNIFDVYDEDTTNFTEFDPSSIMQYAIPDSLTIGTYSVGWNTALSEVDRSFMAQQYPADAPGMVELDVGGERYAADLASGAEVDAYHFDATDAVRHIITTEGATDTVVTLHGPDDPGAVLSWDDDRGRDQNARIVRRLEPGSYWLTVRRKQTGGTGSYTVGVKTYRR
jgi:Astacin (Peptidase family M12A)